MMMKTTKWAVRCAVAMAVALPLAACFEHTYDIGNGAENSAVVYESWRHHWIAGLISPEQELELREICPSGNATIHEEVTFLNGLVGMLTSGIYYPTTVEVRCRGGRRSNLEFSPEDAARFVGDPGFLELVEQVAPELFEEVGGALSR